MHLKIIIVIHVYNSLVLSIGVISELTITVKVDEVK